MIRRIYKKMRILMLRCLSHNALGMNRKHECNICKKMIYGFGEGGTASILSEKKHIIGGGLRENCICPLCKSMDRTRWCYYVLSNYTNLFSGVCTVLHFAPEKALVSLIEQNSDCDYFTADINPKKAKYQVDITDIQFEDGKFDYVIVNHVLEHIPAEGRAISELKRVLKVDGKIIMSFPVCTDLAETFEDAAVKTPAERLEKFGQEDHIRLYGRDAKKRLEGYGLAVKQLSPKDVLSGAEIERYGLIPDDIMFVCEKKY